MQTTIDNIAKALMTWIRNDSSLLRSYWSRKGGWEEQALRDFSKYLINNGHLNSFKLATVYDKGNSDALVFNFYSTNSQEKIIAELSCESFDFEGDYISQIEFTEKIRNKDNLKGVYKNSIRCLIGLYFDMSARNELHDKDFIEIYSNYNIGCAMKMLS